MRILNITLDSCKLLERATYELSPEAGMSQMYRDIYGPMTVTVLVGPNGSGKTTLMSAIVQIFHNLEKTHEKITFNFDLIYEIKDVKNHDLSNIVRITKSTNGVFVEVKGQLPRAQLLPADIGIRRLAKLHASGTITTTYDSVRPYLPKNVIVSAFSVHGEYPAGRPSSFIGDRIVKNYDVGAIYGQNHYSIASLSRGLARLAMLVNSAESFETKLLGRLLDISFVGKVKIRVSSKVRDNASMAAAMAESYAYAEQDTKSVGFDDRVVEELQEMMPWLDAPLSNQWRDVSDALLEAEGRGDVYINDILLHRYDKELSLGNMSAGEKMFFVRLLSVLSSIGNGSIVILEEPELHLDPSWTKQIITVLHAFFSQYQSHFVVATHSFSFINSVFPENIVVLNRGAPSHPAFNTFLANESEISSQLFPSSMDPNLLEEMVRQKLQATEASELRHLLGQLGESYARFEVFKRITDLEREER